MTPVLATRARHVIAAACAVALFHAIAVAGGQLTVNEGLGWDGSAYARMVTQGLEAGNATTQLRPVPVLLARVPYALGLDVLASFTLLNYLCTFVLYFVVSLLLERYGASSPARLIVVLNLAMCIATAKMYAFYPTLIDLPALTLMTVAFYLAATDRVILAAVACMAAAGSREFGFVVALYGMHRSVRLGPWRHALLYVPSLAVTWGIRRIAAQTGDGPLAAGTLLGNVDQWTSPGFLTAFTYFLLTVFGGVSVLLVLRPIWLLSRLRAEPELATFAIVIGGITALGSWDLWRYSVFTLPVAVVLVAQFLRGVDRAALPWVAAAMTVITLVTQRPFARMTQDVYFRDWFPLYPWDNRPLPEDFLPVWTARLAVLALLLVATAVTLRRDVREGRLA